MKSLLFFMASITATNTLASSYIDVIDYYNNASNQYIKPTDKVESNILLVDGTPESKWFWTGKINNKNYSIYANSKTIELSTNHKNKTFTLKNTATIPKEENTEYLLDQRGIDFYIKENKNPEKNLICINSLMPGSSATTPFSQVYLIISPVLHPKIIKLPILNASCLSITINDKGKLQYPVSQMNTPSVHGSINFKYYEINRSGIFPTTETTSIEIPN